MFDVLGLLPITQWLLKSLDDEAGGVRLHIHLTPAVGGHLVLQCPRAELLMSCYIRLVQHIHKLLD